MRESQSSTRSWSNLLVRRLLTQSISANSKVCGNTVTPKSNTSIPFSNTGLKRSWIKAWQSELRLTAHISSVFGMCVKSIRVPWASNSMLFSMTALRLRSSIRTTISPFLLAGHSRSPSRLHTTKRFQFWQELQSMLAFRLRLPCRGLVSQKLKRTWRRWGWVTYIGMIFRLYKP